MADHPVVSAEEWLEARRAHLAREKEFSRQHDRLLEERRALPWVRIDKRYEFDTSAGRRSLAELFGDKTQLVVYHFMFDPEWDEGCPHCSFWADNFDGIPVHLAQRDAQFVVVSRAPLEKIEAFKARMGWSFDWVSSYGSDFNFDFGVAFTPEEVDAGSAVYNFSSAQTWPGEREGISVFHKDADGTVFRTYAAHARGIDIVNGAYQFLDMTPRGRDEAGHDNPQFWVRHHDRYGD
ncbi:MAG TPA: thioredoxin family protein [Candidatus Angelobacter sp.]|jgi:predicted dithiol-disulfide oxidoreductase (DUF899 family)|nr:thioredoxin family protein [Candidatus Angelobacter sp.]